MGTARTKANNKWNAKAYDRVNLVLKKDTSPMKFKPLPMQRELA